MRSARPSSTVSFPRSKPRHARSVACAPACRSWGCPMRKTRPSPATWRRSSAGSSARWPSWKGSSASASDTVWRAPASCTRRQCCSTAASSSRRLLAERTLATINAWLAAEDAAPARLLSGADLDLAVARGAAYYGYVRHGLGVRIRGGTAFAYYVGVESSMPAVPGIEPPVQALCVAPFGMEEGTEAELPALELGLVIGEPVHFRFFASSVRRQDGVGTLLDAWAPDELLETRTDLRHAATGGAQPRRCGAGAPARPCHRGRHARARSRSAQRRRAVEDRIRRARRTPAGRRGGLSRLLAPA